MITSLSAPSPIELPDQLVVECKADGSSRGGLLVSLTVVMLRKNHYNMIFGPSDDNGKIVIGKNQIDSEIGHDLELFPMDYEDVRYFSGDLLVEPMGLREIESALKAYDVFQSVGAYPSGHRDKLAQAWRTLYDSAFRRLEIEVKVIPSVGQPQAPSQAVRIKSSSRALC